jgi:hypothetical protein
MMGEILQREPLAGMTIELLRARALSTYLSMAAYLAGFINLLRGGQPPPPTFF